MTSRAIGRTEFEAAVDCWLVLGSDGVIVDGSGLPGALAGQPLTAVFADSADDITSAMAQMSTEKEVLDVVFAVGVELYEGRLVRTGAEHMLLMGWNATVRLARERALAHWASHDPLTDLPNRLALRERLDELLAGAPADVAVGLIGLSDLKSVNDLAGHHTGDQVLLTVADRLRAALPPDGFAARLTGDEFAVLLAGVDTTDAAVALMEGIVDLVSAPVMVDGFHFDVRATAGVAVPSRLPGGTSGLLRSADLALSEARATQRAVVAFDPEMYRAMMRRLALRSELAHAIPMGAITEVYQPVRDLRTNDLVGVEALARWTSAERGEVSPEEFVALAEDSDLINGIGSAMLREACRQLVQWGSDAPEWVSVNVSPRQLVEGDRLQRDLVAALEASGLAPHRLTVELTERLFIAAPNQAARLLAAIRGLGIAVALDDFGTGYSSLSALGRYPIDVLKLDKGFVEAAVADRTQRRVVEAVIGLGEALGARVVAEGVETADQLSLLQDLGCRYGQGFLLGPPVPAAQLDVT